MTSRLILPLTLLACTWGCAVPGPEVSGSQRDPAGDTARVSRAYLGSRNLGADGLAIDGYSPVSYFEGRAERGSERFAVEYEGVTYHFTDATQVERFESDPDRYVPAFGGWCAFGMAISDKFPVDPTSYKIVDDRLFLFLRNEQISAIDMWNRGDESELKQKAAAHWMKVKG